MEEGAGGLRSLVPGGPLLLVLYGLLEASGGGRALPQLSDDIPFRVNWPGTEFSLVSALTSRSLLPSFWHEAFGPALDSLAFSSRTFFSQAFIDPKPKCVRSFINSFSTLSGYALHTN